MISYTDATDYAKQLNTLYKYGDIKIDSVVTKTSKYYIVKY